ncbi:NAD(P)-dependent dehydrogenase (short-subunit alcohol dehydrogenase family) [Microbacterium terrae]|uniref:Oxidoreductase YghA n=1 Tax=Microbacterium terrae TaxID=69369 RepID=A0A0M2H817_9MICO|nr:SDR family oxidoreductase [Microbacterium terrae]KJL42665.1 putative oxidoreductase YghA [Microbacterium terrae]MBP1079095.1 NAD(P)-dependent dehydrogenase (short-subunit alcohol dehydrogenase family) [Microbacterium terrae]GLJ98495.1 oxidoreductase [Microbacterium terrae]
MGEQSDPRTAYRDEGFPPQGQEQPGLTDETRPPPDHGESTYTGSGRLRRRRSLITGGDSGIGRAVAIAFAREGADVAIAHLPEEQADADATLDLVREAQAHALSLAGDIREERFATGIVDDTIAEFGGLDVLVLNAAYQKDRDGLENLETEEFERVFRTNLSAMLFTARAALPHLHPGASIIVTSSIQAFNPSPGLIDYAMTKAAQVAFVKALAEDLGPRGIRVNAVAPGPIWTPLIPATGWDADRLATFGQDTPLGRAGQPAELAGAYVYLASEDASFVSGAVLPVTGGKGL